MKRKLEGRFGWRAKKTVMDEAHFPSLAATQDVNQWLYRLKTCLRNQRSPFIHLVFWGVVLGIPSLMRHALNKNVQPPQASPAIPETGTVNWPSGGGNVQENPQKGDGFSWNEKVDVFFHVEKNELKHCLELGNISYTRSFRDLGMDWQKLHQTFASRRADAACFLRPNRADLIMPYACNRFNRKDLWDQRNSIYTYIQEQYIHMYIHVPCLHLINTCICYISMYLHIFYRSYMLFLYVFVASFTSPSSPRSPSTRPCGGEGLRRDLLAFYVTWRLYKL